MGKIAKFKMDESVSELLIDLQECAEHVRNEILDLEDEMKEKVEEVNDLISEYNELVCDFNQKSEEIADEVENYILDVTHEMNDLDSDFNESEVGKEAQEWIEEWEDFVSDLRREINVADEVDEPYFDSSSEDTAKELEKHCCYNQPLHYHEVEYGEEEVA